MAYHSHLALQLDSKALPHRLLREVDQRFDVCCTGTPGIYDEIGVPGRYDRTADRPALESAGLNQTCRMIVRRIAEYGTCIGRAQRLRRDALRQERLDLRPRLDAIATEYERGWTGRITQDHGIRLARVLRGVEEIRTLDGAVLRSGEARTHGGASLLSFAFFRWLGFFPGPAVQPDADTCALLAADLAVLAAPPARYDDYVRMIRREYTHVSDDDWRVGRGAVLRNFLERDHLFAPTLGLDEWEQRARANITAELATLDA